MTIPDDLITRVQEGTGEDAPWLPAGSAPEGEIVETKIDDADGVRNVQPLRRSGSLWFVPDGSAYVYYRPTHWRPRALQETRHDG